MSGDDATHSNPTSWRDVYQLVQDMEERLTKRMDSASADLRTITTDVEVRLRVLEQFKQRNLQSDETTKSAISSTQKVIVTVVLLGNFSIALLAYAAAH